MNKKEKKAANAFRGSENLPLHQGWSHFEIHVGAFS